MSILSAKRLQKKYKSRWIVKNVSLSIGNEIVGLLGPNGAGKTTSFYIILGLVVPDSGEVFLDKRNISFYPMHKRARLGVGYLPQETSIFRKLSVTNNIMAILELRKDLSKKQCKNQCEALLKEFHIRHLRDIPGYKLSGGERRRVEIARALTMNPKFILLDEPFSGIDPMSIIDIKKIIIHLRKKGIGILITDHNVRETLDICDRAYVVNAGCIIATGEPKEILNNRSVREIYLGNEFNL
ncbi:LPS export ABC transporter ATP-binding protein [Coxiella endosymbiont of Amblyomma americanum]|uniref:LPS export ABC transporter ATP-binding protein n=1 Tax=Coxiella endosymbiont of Amblyomma americanum TaxID=325775 RepID=UPI00057CCEB5|nr:LPS export ABC transporter ATP-binding protein [Coxiella endosymbiont of Amblyomma americanum]AJC50352.1 sugar ABC transporter ATP-binding protein [Coxiella endosymbiont of Amblyomma americanum]AUJ58698.1 ABC transporter ATP-binding protein [Coxiella-like endosymbiont of Amblyomma americanum]